MSFAMVTVPKYNGNMKRVLNIAAHVAELILAFLFMRGGINALSSPPVAVENLFVASLTGQIAIYIYAFLFFFTGLALVLSKVFKRLKVLHGISLMVMYLTCLYVYILVVYLDGVSWDQWLVITVGIVSAALYLKFKLSRKA